MKKNRENMPEFKVGDMCFSDFELWEITDINTYPWGVCYSIRNGYVETSTDNPYPVNVDINCVAEFFKEIKDKLFNMRSGLNWPEISGYLYSQWRITCDIEDKKAPAQYKKIRDFVSKIEERQKENKQFILNGVKIYA